MEKIRVGLYLPVDHPIAQIEKKNRTTAIYQILDDWYTREQRMKNIEDSLRRIESLLTTGMIPKLEPTPEEGAILDEVLRDILNQGKKGG